MQKPLVIPKFCSLNNFIKREPVPIALFVLNFLQQARSPNTFPRQTPSLHWSAVRTNSDVAIVGVTTMLTQFVTLNQLAVNSTSH